MRNIRNIIFGRDTKSSGLIALTITMLIALGCNCSKNLDLGNLSNSSTTPSNTTTTTNTPKAPTTKADASKGEMPSDDELQAMSKDTLLEFNDAVKSEDFTTFHSNIAKEWQRQTTPEKLKTSFQLFIDKKIDIASIAPNSAVYSTKEIGRELGYKTLMLKGTYQASPNPVKFELNYIPNGKEWKLSKIIVDNRKEP